MTLINLRICLITALLFILSNRTIGQSQNCYATWTTITTTFNLCGGTANSISGNVKQESRTLRWPDQYTDNFKATGAGGCLPYRVTCCQINASRCETYGLFYPVIRNSNGFFMQITQDTKPHLFWEGDCSFPCLNNKYQCFSHFEGGGYATDYEPVGPERRWEPENGQHLCATPTPTPHPTPRVVSDEERACEAELSNNFSSGCSTSTFGIGEARTLSPNRSCCRVSPLVVDMDGDSFHYTDVAGGVRFDLTGDGRKFQVAWPTITSGDAWLVLDRNDNGTIDSGRELFGNFTAQVADVQTGNGFLALAEYDKPVYGGNGDGVINAQDEVFSFLQLWQDANHNGVSEPNELTYVTARNIVSIPLTYWEGTLTDQYGNRFSLKNNVTLSDGSQRVICDSYPQFVPIELSMPYPLLVCDGTGLAATTISWSGPPNAQIRFDSPQGELCASSGGSLTGSMVTGKSLYDGRQIFMVDGADGSYLMSTAISVVPPGNGAAACPYWVTTSGICDGVCTSTISWNFPEASLVQVRLNSFTGPVFANGGGVGSQTSNFTTAPVFYLVDVTNGMPGKLLGSYAVNYSTQTCKILASPNPATVCDGTGLAAVTLNWDSGLKDSVTLQIRRDSATGELVASGGSSGTFTTGKWVSNGTRFVLIQAPSKSGTTDGPTQESLGSTVVTVTSNGCNGFQKTALNKNRR
ncbi:MAG: hypothetical protein HYR56_33950 [Acidobacteria bacterium]|nr:hypothetical protein [Acidobacteriota bacterium]MBI3427750.1 hypothetical protein [Acidobacteriota bacterium]